MDITSFINTYVEHLKETGAVKSDAVENAFHRVPRHLLIEKTYSGKYETPDVLEIDLTNPDHLAMIYSNRALMIRWAPEPSSSSEPALVAAMLEELTLQPGMRVLEIGSGSGYNAALMAEIVSDPHLITTLDIQEDLISQTRRLLTAAGYGDIHVLCQDGFYGDNGHSPYNRIIATVGCSDLSPHWADQLAINGVMLIPLSHGGTNNCPLLRLEKEGRRIVGRVVMFSGFMETHGKEFPQSLWPFPSLEAEIQFSRWLSTAQPVAEYPLFSELIGFPNSPFRFTPEWAGLYEFHYFLALHTFQTFMCWKGVGFGDEQGLVLLNKEGSIQLFSDRANERYEELEQVYQQWLTLGKPRMVDYRLEFTPLSKAKESIQDLGPTPNTWVIDRKFYRQTVSL